MQAQVKESKEKSKKSRAKSEVRKSDSASMQLNKVKTDIPAKGPYKTSLNPKASHSIMY